MDETNQMKAWVKLLSGSLSAEEAEPLLRQGVGDLHAFLESEPQAEQHVLDILSRRLSGESNGETWQVMDDSLRQYFGQDMAYLVYWVARVEDPTVNRMSEVEEYASPQVMAFLRTVVGIYGPDISDAYALWNRLPDDWRHIYRDVYYDRVNQRHHLRVRIKKYNGEEIVFQGSPDSILHLISRLIYTLRLVGTATAFNQSRVSMFIDESSRLTELLTAEKKEVTVESPESEAATERQ